MKTGIGHQIYTLSCQYFTAHVQILVFIFWGFFFSGTALTIYFIFSEESEDKL